MRFILRAMTGEDVDKCFEMVCLRPGYAQYFSEDHHAEQYRRVWRNFLTRPAVVSGLLEGVDEEAARHILCAGFAAYVRPEWWESYLADPFPFPGRWLMDEIAAGRDEIVLGHEELAKYNSSSGLYSLTVHIIWNPEPCPPEQQFTMNQHAVRIFQIAHAGYQIRELLCEISPGPESARYIESGAWEERASFGESDLRTILAGRSREEITRCAKNGITPLGPLFVWNEPRFQFTPAQQKLLLLARTLTSDKELADALKISTSAVARMFDRIYKRVVKRQDLHHPVFRANVDVTRKRVLLLEYLRENMWELRPYVGVTRLNSTNESSQT